MSKQLNYFGGPKSNLFIWDEIARIMGPVRLLRSRSPKPDFEEIERGFFGNFFGPREAIAIVPEECEQAVKMRGAQEMDYRIDFQTSPAIEWTPALVVGDTSTLGRLYLNYQNPFIESAFRQLSSCFRSHCKPIVYGHRFWVFEDAENIPNFQGWVGKPFPNPLIKKN